ncbi:MAG: exopolyphosphatase [Bacteroidia bacterium]
MKAIIDLGTNTFHLLIAEVKNGVIREYFKLQVPVKIGQGGIIKGIITPEAKQRAHTALAEFRKYLDRFEVKEIKALATSAIRGATNGDEFLTEAKELHGIIIEKISGDTEAECIYEGVSHSFDLPTENILVMDIGGGSVELIIGQKETILWKQSFDLGAARMIEHFSIHDPILQEEIELLESYFSDQLFPLTEALQKFPVSILVGSAGSFETLVDVVLKDLEVIPNSLSKHAYEIRRQDFDVFHELMITSSAEQRSKLKGMADFRIEMIVVASILIKLVTEKYQLKKIIASDYSLKEGMMFRMSGGGISR